MIFYKRRKFYAGRSFFFTMAKFFCVFIKTVVIIIINILVDENDVVITLSLSMSLRHGVNYGLRHNKNNTSFVKL